MHETRLFVGKIRPLPQSGRPTGMYKQPVTTALELGVNGFVDDQQADLRVHGGPEKAVHQYPAQHYRALAARFPQLAATLVPGGLGENLSTDDLDENDVRIGEVWALGTAELQLCQPRSPCWKIDERYCEGMAAYIAENFLTGWYWRVLRPGRVAPGDRLVLARPAPDSCTLHQAMSLWHTHRPALSALEHLAATPGIASTWREKIEQRIAWLKKNG